MYLHCGIKQAHFIKVRHIFPNCFRFRFADNAVYLIFMIAAGENKEVYQEDRAEQQREPLEIPKTHAMHGANVLVAQTYSNFK